MTKLVLDVGCGGGRYRFHAAITQKLAEVLHLDIETPRTEISPFVRADVRHLPFQNNSFDVVYCYAILEHIHKPLEGLKCLRVSRQGAHVRTDGLLFLPNWTASDHKFFSLGHYYVSYPRWLKVFIMKFIARLLINKFALPFLRRAKMMNDLDYYAARWNYYFYLKTESLRLLKGYEKKNINTPMTNSKKALVVTTSYLPPYYALVQPVVEALRTKKWKVTTLRFENERIWKKIAKIYDMKEYHAYAKRSLESFYAKTPLKRPKRINWYIYNLIAAFAFHLINLFGLEKPHIIIVMADQPLPCKIAILLGRFAHIPSLRLLNTGVVPRNYPYSPFYADKIALTDKIAVTGRFTRDVLIKLGIDKNKLVITGRPSYDALAHANKHFNKDKICRKLGLDSTKKILVYATENLPRKETEQMVYTICKAVKAFPELQFIIKVHPSEPTQSIYKKITRDLGVNTFITKDANIFEILFICDIMIAAFSTTALEAMILDKPVISLNFTDLEEPIPYAESGAAIGVHKDEDLVGAIRRGLYDEDSKEKLQKARKKFVYEHCYKMDGKATERVVRLIEQMT